MFLVHLASWLQLIEFHFHVLMNQLCRLVHPLPTLPVAVALCRSRYRAQLYFWPKALAG
jgi:hypothetical protein